MLLERNRGGRMEKNHKLNKLKLLTLCCICCQLLTEGNRDEWIIFRWPQMQHSGGHLDLSFIKSPSRSFSLMNLCLLIMCIPLPIQTLFKMIILRHWSTRAFVFFVAIYFSSHRRYLCLFFSLLLTS